MFGIMIIENMFDWRRWRRNLLAWSPLLLVLIPRQHVQITCFRSNGRMALFAPAVITLIIIKRRHVGSPLYECAHCHHQASLTVDTVMEGSRTPMQKWFIAFYHLSQPHSINAFQLKEEIHVTYKTAWSMLHKIRHALREEDASVLLSGFVQVHDACRGIEHNSVYQRQPKEQLLLLGATMNGENEPIYIKMKLLLNQYLNEWTVSRPGKEAFIRDHVQPEAAAHVSIVTGIFKSQRYKLLLPYFTQAKRWIVRPFTV
jgi:hypothetical protein